MTDDNSDTEQNSPIRTLSVELETTGVDEFREDLEDAAEAVEQFADALERLESIGVTLDISASEAFVSTPGDGSEGEA